MNKITELLNKGNILVSDGAWGTFLQAKGLAPGECPELWNLTAPGAVFDIAKSYIDAGADIIETNSFGGSRIKLKHYGLEDKTYELNKAASLISRQAAGDDRIVIGSIGPTGKILMMGEVSGEEMYESFSVQVKGLADGGADALVVETMTDLEEALVAIRACKAHTRLEVICTMTFDKTVNGDFRTIMGISPAEMTSSLKDAGVDIIGTNCGNGMKNMAEIVKEIRSADETIPILVHANAGIPVYRDGKTLFPETPEEMSGLVIPVVEAGASIVGGCCGTTPAHISMIKKSLKNNGKYQLL